jgi:hypothetical protein
MSVMSNCGPGWAWVMAWLSCPGTYAGWGQSLTAPAVTPAET